MRKTVKNSNGVTIVSLVVTIIILILLVGISINMTIGNNGILTIAKKAKENIELSKIEEEKSLNELYEQIGLEDGVLGDTLYDSIAKLNDFKKRIADYIEEAGGIKPEYTTDVETFGDRIKGIVKEVTKNATATPEDIQEGKTAWVNGELITGNGMHNTISSAEVLYTYKTETTSTAIATYTFTKSYSKAYVVIAGGNNTALSNIGSCTRPSGSIKCLSALISNAKENHKASGSSVYELSNVEEGEKISWRANYYPTCCIFGIN